MRPRHFDPFSASPEEDLAEALDLFEFAETQARRTLRAMSNRPRILALVAAGHLRIGRFGTTHKTRTRLAVRSICSGRHVVLRRGREVVRLPFA